jgi:hypothetical protein
MEPSFSIHPTIRQYLKMASYGNILEVFPTLPFPKTLADLAGFPETYLKQQIIYGVFNFGSQQYLNLPSEFMIWLCNPWEQVQLHALQCSKNAASVNEPYDMATILNAKSKTLDNYYTRLISGLDVAFGECTEDMLETAISNLKKNFIFIGINEQQSRSIDRLCVLMDWDRSLFPYELPVKFTVDINAFSDADLTILQTLTEYDRRLYEAAVNLCEEMNPTQS